MAWLAENLPLFWTAAQAAYAELGRGAITVDTTDTSTGDGHPYWYLTQEQLNALGDNDALRMVSCLRPDVGTRYDAFEKRGAREHVSHRRAGSAAHGGVNAPLTQAARRGASP